MDMVRARPRTDRRGGWGKVHQYCDRSNGTARWPSRCRLRLPRGDQRAACPRPAFIVAAVRRLPFVHGTRVRQSRPKEIGLGGGKVTPSGFGRPNGSDAKLHGQGPRAEARAARGALHVRRANARRVTPRGFDVSSRLGRRAEAGPCQLLRRVGPRGFR